MEEFARQFGIDGKLLLSQAVNFFLLLVILRAFVYKPVLGILQKRKERIEEGLLMARAAEEKLSRADTEAAEKMKGVENKAIAVLERAETDAKKREAAMLEEAERKKERLMNEAKLQLLGEEEKMRQSFAREAKAIIRVAFEKAVGEAPEKIDEAFIARAAKEMKQA